LPQILKVVPYSAIQLCSYEFAKKRLRDPETGNLTVLARLSAGAFAGMTATLVRGPCLCRVDLDFALSSGLEMSIRLCAAWLQFI
jgi:solute carrier family 25 phosphate transporter 23/24/25/41